MFVLALLFDESLKFEIKIVQTLIFIATFVVQVRWRHNRSQELDGEVRQTEAGTLSILRQGFPKMS